MEPETSTSENPMNAHRTKLFDKEGLRQIEIIGNEDIRPTPIPTPADQIPLNIQRSI
jgi:hypothetical protein